jgi:hypothetical protein
MREVTQLDVRDTAPQRLCPYQGTVSAAVGEKVEQLVKNDVMGEASLEAIPLMP